ncbi:HP1 family phage holin [Cedecea davisae]|uniref:HP1 family phage holin n=1 Tax=Cedecea davisae TaxID=158484 RepID=UPI00242BA1EC|nr:HP1 family phage holin [Cedecea davisae]
MEKYSAHVSFLSRWVLTTIGFFSIQNWAILIGIFLGIGSFLLNWYYKHRIVKLLALKKLEECSKIVRITEE